MPQHYAVGFGQEIVTPPLGCAMAGFDARKGVAAAVHDDLYARALAIDDVILISVDVIGFDSAFASRVRAEVASETGIPSGHVVLTATHTHCGPVTLRHFFNQAQTLDPDYLDFLRARIVRASLAATRARVPSCLRAGMAPVTDVARNRRSEDGLPVDPAAGVLAAEPLDGSPGVVLVNYACHPTVLGPDTLQLSADFPGYAVRHIESATGARAIFFQGAEGDLSMGHRSDLSAVGIIAPSRTFAKAEDLGTRLARAVVENLGSLALLPHGVAVRTRDVDLPTKDYAPLAEMVRLHEEAASALAAEDSIKTRQRELYSRIEEYYAGLPRRLTAELTAVRMGDTAFVSIPGELFVAISLEIRRRAPFNNTLFLGLANGYIGYLPTADATAEAGYEVTASQVSPAAASVLIEESLSLLNSLRN